MAWTVSYEANELPDAATPVWTKSGDETTLEISPAGYLHHVALNGGLDYTIQVTTFKSATGGTIEARLKVIAGEVWDDQVASGYSTLEMLILDAAETGRYQPILDFYSDAICFDHDLDNKYEMDTTDDYHVYRLTFKDGVANVYVDGVLRLTASDIIAGGGGNTYSTFKPEAYGVANIETSWDYVYYRTDGAVPPKNQQLKQNKYR